MLLRGRIHTHIHTSIYIYRTIVSSVGLLFTSPSREFVYFLILDVICDASSITCVHPLKFFSKYSKDPLHYFNVLYFGLHPFHEMVFTQVCGYHYHGITECNRFTLIYVFGYFGFGVFFFFLSLRHWLFGQTMQTDWNWLTIVNRGAGEQCEILHLFVVCMFHSYTRERERKKHQMSVNRFVLVLVFDSFSCIVFSFFSFWTFSHVQSTRCYLHCSFASMWIRLKSINSRISIERNTKCMLQMNQYLKCVLFAMHFKL